MIQKADNFLFNVKKYFCFMNSIRGQQIVATLVDVATHLEHYKCLLVVITNANLSLFGLFSQSHNHIRFYSILKQYLYFHPQNHSKRI